MASKERSVDWSGVRELARRVLVEGALLGMSDETCAILRQGALDVGISPADADAALADISSATHLLRHIWGRITAGSERLDEMDDLIDDIQAGEDFASVRESLEKARGVEVAPCYRELLTDRLNRLGALEASFLTGRLSADLSPWELVRMLALRVQQGQPLDLNEETRAFLREAAESVALDTAETEEALQSAQGAAALVGKVATNIREGRERLNGALLQWAKRFEAGDLEGANRPLRDYLTAETVPFYRKAAADLLTDDGEPPAGS